MGDLIGDSSRAPRPIPAPSSSPWGCIPDFESTRSFATLKAARATQAAPEQAGRLHAGLAGTEAGLGHGHGRLFRSRLPGVPVSPADPFSLPGLTPGTNWPPGVWRGLGFDLQSDTFQPVQSLMLGLPMAPTPRSSGRRNGRGGRASKTSANAIHLAPVIGEWAGLGNRSRLPCSAGGQALGWTCSPTLRQLQRLRGGHLGLGQVGVHERAGPGYLGTGARVWVIDAGRP